ncbi:hypothetical protein ACFU0X_10250 [Streptomyces cellulosae]|uniref:Uncharacterized protein n=1 Tax=Streptomyces cellulosae TaxID=1968 RepID=A0ABW6JGY2_STRCE
MNKRKKRRTFGKGCAVVAAFMAATYWTIRALEAGIDLAGAVGPWV